MREDGLLTVISPDGHVLEERKTFQCVHCGKHFELMRGKTKEAFLKAGFKLEAAFGDLGYGWCMKCDGPTCGARECDQSEMLVHRHYLHKLEQLEKKFNG